MAAVSNTAPIAEPGVAALDSLNETEGGSPRGLASSRAECFGTDLCAPDQLGQAATAAS